MFYSPAAVAVASKVQIKFNELKTFIFATTVIF